MEKGPSLFSRDNISWQTPRQFALKGNISLIKKPDVLQKDQLPVVSPSGKNVVS